jgi:hypothetical protein
MYENDLFNAAASLIAEPLVRLDDTEAQRAVDIYVPRDKAKVHRHQKVAGEKPQFTMVIGTGQVQHGSGSSPYSSFPAARSRISDRSAVRKS